MIIQVSVMCWKIIFVFIDIMIIYYQYCSGKYLLYGVVSKEAVIFTFILEMILCLLIGVPSFNGILFKFCLILSLVSTGILILSRIIGIKSDSNRKDDTDDDCDV